MTGPGVALEGTGLIWNDDYVFLVLLMGDGKVTQIYLGPGPE